MIGNNDIFDEEELLAIANDDDDESSSCHSSSLGSEVERNTSLVDGSATKFEDAKVVGIHTSEQKTATSQNDGILTNNVKDDVEHPISNLHSVGSNISNTKEKGNKDSDGSSSDDDGGFLESWLEEEKKKSVSATQNTLQDATTDFEAEDDFVSQTSGVQGTKTKKEEEEDNANQNDKRHTIHLGKSILQWISSSKSSEGNISGIVGIQQNHNEQGAFSPQSSTLHLTTSSSNDRKRSRTGPVGGDTVTIEQIEANTPGGKITKLGQIVRTSNTAEEKASTPGAMVDCLARFDHQKKCYVLEIVDLLVNNLESTKSVDANKTTTNANHAGELLYNPLLSSKRAEAQVKKLKRSRHT